MSRYLRDALTCHKGKRTQSWVIFYLDNLHQLFSKNLLIIWCDLNTQILQITNIFDSAYSDGHVFKITSSLSFHKVGIMQTVLSTTSLFGRVQIQVNSLFEITIYENTIFHFLRKRRVVANQPHTMVNAPFSPEILSPYNRRETTKVFLSASLTSPSRKTPNTFCFRIAR